MANASEEKKLPLNLAVYNEPEEAVLPKYRRRLNVYRFCEIGGCNQGFEPVAKFKKP